MNKRIFYIASDGSPHLIVPAPAARFDDEADDAFLARIAAKDVPSEAKTVRIVDAADLPEDIDAGAMFFRAWTVKENQIGIDMVVARNLWRHHIREARKPLLAILDIEYLRAEERGDSQKKSDIAARKQRLREAPSDPAIESAETIASLRAVWPLDEYDS